MLRRIIYVLIIFLALYLLLNIIIFYPFLPSLIESILIEIYYYLYYYLYLPIALIFPVLIIKYVSEIDVTLPKWYFPVSLTLVLYIFFAIGFYAQYINFFPFPIEFGTNIETGTVYKQNENSAFDALIVMPSFLFVFVVWWIGSLALIRAETPQNRSFIRTFIIFLQFLYLVICFYFIYRRFERLPPIKNDDNT